MIEQRPVRDDERWTLRMQGDTIAQRISRVVELRSTSILPDDCEGAVVLPSLDSTDRSEIRYPVRTATAFALTSVRCVFERDCALEPTVLLSFSAPLPEGGLLLHVRSSPAGAIKRVELGRRGSSVMTVELNAAPGDSVRLFLDERLYDSEGRGITGAREVEIVVGDRRPAIAQPAGFITLVGREAPVLWVSHVNVESIEAEIVLVDSARAARALVPRRGFGIRPGIAGRDTIRRTVRLSSPLNAVVSTAISIPELTRDALTRAVAVRLRYRPTPDGPRRTIIRTRYGSFPEQGPDSIVTEPAIVQATNLMAHAKVDESSGAVFVTQWATGAPVVGARVALRDTLGNEVATASTDSSGIARLGAPRSARRVPAGIERPSRLVEVTWRGDRSITPVALGFRREPRADLSLLTNGEWYNSRPVTESGIEGIAFTDRAIYRPGERVYVSAIVRERGADRLSLPLSGDSIRWNVTSYSVLGTQSVLTRVRRLSSFGTSSDSFNLGSRAEIGPYSVSIEQVLDGAWRPVASGSFRVAEYRAPEFLVDLTPDSAPAELRETVGFLVRARYLFEAPMPGAAVSWKADLTEASPAELRIPGLPPRFGFGDPPSSRWLRRRSGAISLSGQDTVHADGSLHLRIPTDARSVSGPVRMQLTVSVSDVTRQAITTSGSRMVSGSAFYLAVRDSTVGPTWSAGTSSTLSILAVRKDGRRVRDAQATITVVRAEPFDVNMPAVKWDTVWTHAVRTADSVVKVAITPEREGQYVVLLTATDSLGREVETQISRYVGKLPRVIPPPRHPTALPLTASEGRRTIGDTAFIGFNSPFDSAEAWVTVERDGILFQWRLLARRGNRAVAVPITRAMTPTALVSVLLVNRAAVMPDDSVHHHLRRGTLTLQSDSMVRRLQVAIAPPAHSSLPGDSARVDLRVTDMTGRAVRSTVTVWAVDEGVIALVPFRPPTPWLSLGAYRGPWMVTTSTLLSTIVPRPVLLMPGRSGSDSAYFAGGTATGLEAARTDNSVRLRGMTAVERKVSLLEPRDEFRTTAFFRAVVVTDANGRATVRVTLPDNVTTYRVIALASEGEDRFGRGEGSIVATKPLVLRAALPRFVRPGDEMFAGAALTLREGEARAVTVTADATGIRLSGPRRHEIQLGLTTAESRFSWKALETDSARITLSALGGDLGDAVRLTLPVKPARFPVAETITGMVRDTVTALFGLPAGVDVSRSRLVIRVGTSPLPLLDLALDYLQSYPYYCTDQLTSTGQALVAELALERAGLRSMSRRKQVTATLRSVADQLLRRQRADGSLGYWTKDSWSNPTLTSAAGLVLLDARDAGIPVDSALTNRVAAYLEAHLRGTSFNPDSTFGTTRERWLAGARHFSERLAAVEYLARSGRDVSREALQLGEVAGRLHWEDRLRLALLLHSIHAGAQARQLLADAWSGTGMLGRRVDIPDSLLTGGLFSSRIRPVARLVLATIAIDPGREELGALMERLAQRAQAGRTGMWNTHDHAAAALAAAAFTRAFARGASRVLIQVTIGAGATRSVELLSRRGAATDLEMPLSSLDGSGPAASSVALRMRSDGAPVFYAVTSIITPAVADVRPAQRGLTVERWYERFDNGTTVTEVSEGDLVRVRMRVTLDGDREFVAVEDQLPAGLEAVDLSLRTSSTLGAFAPTRADSALRARDRDAGASSPGPWWWSPWEHSEIRDDRVLYFARMLWKGTYAVSYVARATTAGRFVRPPAHGEEMYNPAVRGQSDGGWFVVSPRSK